MRARRILLVDDDRVTLDAVGTLLSSHGYEIGTCENGAQALDLTNKGGWDLVILDLGLPSPDPDRVARFDGLKVLKWLKLLHRTVPVLVFTSSQDPEMANVTIAAGAVGLIRKGDPLESFLGAVRGALALQAEPEPESKTESKSDPGRAPSAPTPPPLLWSDHDERLAGS